MTNIPKELQQKIEREAEVWAFSGKWSNNNDEAGDNFGSYQKGALSIAVQLAKAVEVIKYYADQGFENAIPEDAQEFLEEHESWLNEK